MITRPMRFTSAILLLAGLSVGLARAADERPDNPLERSPGGEDRRTNPLDRSEIQIDKESNPLNQLPENQPNNPLRRPEQPAPNPLQRPEQPAPNPLQRPANPPAAADPTKPAADDRFANPLQQVVPAAAIGGGKAPEWVKPGARITYWLGSGSFSSVGSGLFKQDPNGNIKDTDGNTYSRQDHSGNIASAGYLIYTVRGLTDDGRVVLAMETYGLGAGHGAVPIGVQILRVDAGTGNGIWSDPEKLADVRPSTEGAMSVLVGPWQLDQRVYNAVTFAMPGTHNTYDRKTGMLIAGSQKSTTTGKAGFELSPDKTALTPKSGTRTHSVIKHFKGFRTQNLPWLEAPPPQWVRKGTRLEYRKTSWIELGGARPIPAVDGFTTKVLDTGNGWVLTEMTLHTVSGQRLPKPIVGESTQTSNGGSWINPAVLQKLQPGQVLDEDPLVRSKTVVANVGQAPDGRRIVEFMTRAEGFNFSSVYDLNTGAMLMSHLLDKTTNFHTRHELVGMQPAGE